MCFFGGGGGSGSGPQSSADIASGGYRPPVKTMNTQPTSGANPHNDAATPQGRREATVSKQTANRNVIRRASQSALNNYSSGSNKTILGS